MNIIWIHDGKKFTILGTLMIGLALFGILATESTLQAALFGVLLPIAGIFTIKSAMGWSTVRSWEK